MDYEAVMKALARFTYKPGHNMVTDADLIMARAWLKISIPQAVTEEWVMGYASEKEKNSPETITDLKHDNSECDSDAEQYIQ